MDVALDLSSENPVLAQQAKVLARPSTLARRMADAIRALAIDATEQAGSSHSVLPIGMADVATALWTRFHKFDAADPHWPDRDRFVLSAGDGAMLLYALIHLTGHDGMSIDNIRETRQLQSPAGGHPEYGEHPAIECTTGSAGQGLAMATGMALAERNMAARFGKSLVDHRTWVIASDGDLQEGISHEAASLAGHLGLSKLTVLFDDNQIAATNPDTISGSDDVLKRFSAYGWATKRIDGHDPTQIHAALSSALRSKKPTLLACQTVLGARAETPADFTNTDCNLQEAADARQRLGWHELPFVTPDDLKTRWQAVGTRGAAARRAWLKRLARHAQRSEFERVLAGRLPDTWYPALTELKQQFAEERPRFGTRTASQRCLEALLPAVPELLGGSTDVTGASLTATRGVSTISAGNYSGRYVHYGIREHGMAAAANGMALHGGLIPFIGTFFVFSDHMRPALRLAAIMRQRVIFVLSGDGATYQPVEHLASLRAMPNLNVFRPADATETAECWELAVRRVDGPTLLVLSQQALPAWRTDIGENRCARGGYVLAEAEGPRQATIIATGSEIAIAMAAREKLAGDNIAAAVVSLPCWNLFAQQDPAYRAEVLGGAPRIGIEAAGAFGWEQWLGPDGTFIGMTGFGASANYEDLYRVFGISPEAAVAAVMRRLG